MIPLVSDTSLAETSFGLHAAMLNNLVDHGWSQHNLFLPTDLALTLAAECQALQTNDELTLAGVGRGILHEIKTSIRGDQIGAGW